MGIRKDEVNEETTGTIWDIVLFRMTEENLAFMTSELELDLLDVYDGHHKQVQALLKSIEGPLTDVCKAHSEAMRKTIINIVRDAVMKDSATPDANKADKAGNEEVELLGGDDYYMQDMGEM